MTLGGQKVGRVAAIDFTSAPQPDAIDVKIRVREDLELREDAVVQLVIPLLGANSQVNIVSLGTPSAHVADEETPIDGALAPPSFLAQAGYGPDQQQQVKHILTNLDETSAWLNEFRQTLEVDITSASERLDHILENMDAIAADLGEKWPQWSGRADSILAATDEQIGPLFADARAGVEDVRRAVGKAEGVLDENREDIRSTVANVEELSRRLNGDAYEDFQAVLERATAALDNFSTTAEEARKLIELNGPQLGLIIANARLASDQLKATAVEVRHAPWRLLYQPGRKEFENELLYESVRTYAGAVSDLRATAATLRNVAETGSTTSDDTRTVDEIVADLQEAFDRYEKAEREFLDQWLQE
jgi:ABC-type transporter Mla subunit MlaD